MFIIFKFNIASAIHHFRYDIPAIRCLDNVRYRNRLRLDSYSGPRVRPRTVVQSAGADQSADPKADLFSPDVDFYPEDDEASSPYGSRGKSRGALAGSGRRQATHANAKCLAVTTTKVRGVSGGSLGAIWR